MVYPSTPPPPTRTHPCLKSLCFFSAVFSYARYQAKSPSGMFDNGKYDIKSRKGIDNNKRSIILVTSCCVFTIYIIFMVH